MTYETMDWEAEAERVAQAFGLRGHYRFKPWYDDARQFQLDGTSLVPIASSAQLSIAYEGVRKFTIWLDGHFDTYIGIALDDRVRGQTFAGRGTNIIARGLFNLGLLTPEVEQALEVHITAHEKLEWALEYEARMGNL